MSHTHTHVVSRLDSTVDGSVKGASDTQYQFVRPQHLTGRARDCVRSVVRLLGGWQAAAAKFAEMCKSGHASDRASPVAMSGPEACSRSLQSASGATLIAFATLPEICRAGGGGGRWSWVLCAITHRGAAAVSAHSSSNSVTLLSCPAQRPTQH